MARPKVSVVMSAYNTEDFLAEAIESILNQTYRDFEFIIIDDGSKDKTPQIIKDYAAKDSRIVFRSRPNKGMPKSLNEAIALGKGEYIARQDSDDISDKRRLETQVRFLEANPEVGLVGTNLQYVDMAGNPFRISDLPTHPDDLRFGEIFINQFGHGSIMIRRSIFERAGGYNSADFPIVEDYDLWARVNHLTKLANLKEPLYSYRQHPGAVTRNRQVIEKYASKTMRREFKYYLRHKSEFRFFSFHPLSMHGGVTGYLKWKNRLYSIVAYRFMEADYRARAILAALISVAHAPWIGYGWRQLWLTLFNPEAAVALRHKGF